MKKLLIALSLLFVSGLSYCVSILIPMDEQQKNHLKAYGLAYWSLKKEQELSWLLNYRGGSFLLNYHQQIENELKIRGISYEVLADGKVTAILTEIADPEVNMEIVKLEKAPKVAV